MEMQVSLRVKLKLGALGVYAPWAAVRDRGAIGGGDGGGGFELCERGVR